MTIIQLQYVLKVAEYKNFTVAAEKSFVSQPTLSMQVQKLEKELDVEIFDRSSNPITITVIGKKIIEQVKIILNEANRLTQIVEEGKNSMRGTITLGIIPTILPTFVPLFYKIFRNKYSETNLIIKELKTNEIVQQILSDSLDFAIVSGPLNILQIIEKPIYKEPLVYYLSDRDPLYNKAQIKISDINFSQLLLLEEGNCFRDNVLDLCEGKENYKSKINLESGSFSTLIKLVNEGYGATFLPLLEAEDLSDKDKEYIRFLEPCPYREISLIYNNSQIRSTFINNFIQLVKSILRGKLFLENQNNPTLIIL